MALVERPHEEHDTEGFMAPRPQEGTVLDGRAPDDAATLDATTVHDQETIDTSGTPGVFSSLETQTDPYDSHATEETGAIIHDDAPEGAETIADRAAKYLRDLHKEKETQNTTSTALEVVTQKDKPTEAPVNEIRSSTEVIALPAVKSEPQTPEAVVETSVETDALSLDELVEEDHAAADATQTETAHSSDTETLSLDEVLEDEPSTETTTEELAKAEPAPLPTNAQTTEVTPSITPEVEEDDKTPPATTQAEPYTFVPPTVRPTATPERKPRRRGIIGGLVAGVAGLAAVAGLAIPRDSSDTTTPERVNPNPVPPAGAEAPTTSDSAPVSTEANTTTVETIKVTTPHTQPANHLPVLEVQKGIRPSNYIDEQAVGDFQLGMSLKDLEIMKYDASNQHKDNAGIYSIPDGDRTIVVGVDEKTGVVDAIHIESADVKTQAGIHVGSTESEIKAAYGSQLKEKEFAVNGITIKTLVLEDEDHKQAGAMTVFTLSKDGKVAAIDLLDVLGTSRADTGPVVSPASLAEK